MNLLDSVADLGLLNITRLPDFLDQLPLSHEPFIDAREKFIELEKTPLLLAHTCYDLTIKQTLQVIRIAASSEFLNQKDEFCA
jgi:hypothetical protein